MASTDQPFDSPTGEPIDDPTGELGRPLIPGDRDPSGEPGDLDPSGIDASITAAIDDVVDTTPGVWGALVSSADGLVIASKITHRTGLDTPAIAAMSAAVLGLSNRLVQLMGPAPTSFSHQRSTDGQVFVFGIDQVAALTILAAATADPSRIETVGQQAGRSLGEMIRAAAGG